MPSTIVHSLCAEKALAISDANELRKMINRNRWAFIYGCQGPDFLFFYRAMPIYSQAKARKVQTLGSLLHHQKINEAFRFMIKRAQESHDETLISYLAGFLSHHAMDSQAHPYVYWRTHSLAGKVGFLHQQLEAQMERGVLDYFKLKTGDYVPARMMKHRRGRETEIARLMSDLVTEVYGRQLTPQQCATAMKDFRRLFTPFYDPSGRRQKAVAPLERLVKRPDQATALMTPVRYDDALDALNLRRDDWYHPVTREKYNTSVMQMFEAAVVESRQRFELLERLIKEGQTEQQLLEHIGNLGYDTGTAEGEMTFFALDQKGGVSA